MAEDTMFQDAVDALRQGDKAHAKEILTRLLKADQSNVTYWIWMSASVETPKERIYCLQTALSLDPENGIAKRGLILLGALAPDEKVQPFPLNRPRAWEEKLLLAHEKPKQKGLRAAMSNPLTRLAGVALLVTAVGAVAVFGLLSPRNNPLRIGSTNTPGPSPTFTLTPTFVNFTPQAGTPVKFGPTSLSVLFGVSYTATPLPVNTPRSPVSQDIYRGAKAAYERSDWDAFISDMNEVARAEPTSADVPFYIGEAYRFKGECRNALDAYNAALKINIRFAPAYVGLARARICIDPGADTTALYDLAISADPNYGETYLDRANFYLERTDPNAALPDLEVAQQRMPDSALVQLGFARAYLMKNDAAKALAAAQKANEIDITILPSYYYLGKAYELNQQYLDAIKPLETYLKYQPDDGSAYALLGQAYAKTGAYKLANETLSKGLDLDPTQRQSYVYLGISNLELNNLVNAETDFKKAIQYFPDSFDANIGLTQTYYKNGSFGSAYLQAETSKSKAQNDTERALAIYWRALSQEGRGSIADAIRDFKLLLSMPENVMTPKMRQDAEDHLKNMATPTKTPTPTSTPRPGKATATQTPTPTKKP
ncbi:MAG: tetratricopeptide repeat protein [Chloroflexi bacterium]|nr:tetratricopeptide repeat protein [Chloroflexota bacterium]MBI3340216.1 tetratricopeptide repeat protein [Chloroflexota bacterium]